MRDRAGILGNTGVVRWRFPQVPGGTSSTIDCVVGSAGPGQDISLSLPDLVPGTYTCTTVIDP